MNRLILLAAFFALYVYVDYQVFQALKSIVNNSSVYVKLLVFSLYWCLTLVSLLLIVFWGKISSVESAILKSVMVTGFGMNLTSKLFAGIFLFGGNIVQLLTRWYQGLVYNGTIEKATDGLTRSEFINKSAIVVGAIPITLMGYGVVTGAYDYRVRRREVFIKGLPRAFDGLKIGQLSDIHSGSFFNKTAVKGGIDLLMSEKPDIFLFTGDLVNNEAKEVKDYVDIFSKIKAPLGQFSVLGNHDYGDYKRWSSVSQKQKNLEDLVQTHKNMGWDIMLNENRSLIIDGEPLALIGVENWGKGGFAKYGDLNKATKGVESDIQILLSHDPSHWDAQVRDSYANIDLMLAGHTHGFQFGVEIGDFRWSPSQYLYKQWADLYKEEDQYLYVNRGFGFLGFPGRVGILPEVTILELKQAQT